MGHGDWGWGALPLPWWKMFIFNIYLLPKWIPTDTPTLKKTPFFHHHNSLKQNWHH
jgi:hypothetical protein